MDRTDQHEPSKAKTETSTPKPDQNGTPTQQATDDKKSTSLKWKAYRHGDDAWIPNRMRMLKYWISYVYCHDADKKKYRKRPGYIDKQGQDQNLDAFNTHNQKEYTPGRAGFMPQGQVVCIDIDLPRNPDDPEVIKFRKLILEQFEAVTYVEKSLSNVHGGKDKWHIFVFAKGIKAMDCPTAGIEIAAEGKKAILTTGIDTNKLEVEEQQELVEDLIDQLQAFNTADEEKAAAKAKAVEQRAGATTNPKATTNQPATTPTAKPTTPPRSVKDKDRRDAEAILKAFKDQGFDLCPDNKSFLIVGCALISIFGVDRANDILANEAGYDKGVRTRLKSLAKKVTGSQIASLVAYAKKRGVKLPSMGDSPTNKQGATSRGKGKKGESTPIKRTHRSDIPMPATTEPLVQYLPPPGKTMGIAGDAGTYKTRFFFDRVKSVHGTPKYKNYKSVLISNDMPGDDVFRYLDQHGIPDDRIIYIDMTTIAQASLEDILAIIDTERDKENIAIVGIDTAFYFLTVIWQSLKTGFRFEPNTSLETVMHSCKFVFNEIAKKFNCVTMVLEHVSRNQDSTWTFPGHSKWEGSFTGSCWRFYKPDSRAPLVYKTRMKEMGDDWRYARCLRDRFKTERSFAMHYEQKELGAGRIKYDDDELGEIEADTAQCATSFHNQVIECLADHEEEKFVSLSQLVRENNSLAPDLVTARGLLTSPEVAKAHTAGCSGGLFYKPDPRNHGLTVAYLPADKLPKRLKAEFVKNYYTELREPGRSHEERVTSTARYYSVTPKVVEACL